MTQTLDQLYCKLLTDHVSGQVVGKGRGHCLRIDDVPSALARMTVRSLREGLGSPHHVVVVSSDPAGEFDISPFRAVELRNAADDPDADVGVLVIFVPPTERLTVEDSIGTSTFATVSVRAVEGRLVEEALGTLESIDPDLVSAVRRVLDVISENPKVFGHLTMNHRAGYVLAVANNAQESPEKGRRAVGASLAELGLLPDLTLAGLDDVAIARRLELNQQQMEVLTDPVDPIDRVRQLPLDEDAPPERARALLDAVEDGETDAFTVARRTADAAEIVDFGEWGLGQGKLIPDRFEIMKLSGDFDHDSDLPEVRKSEASIGIDYVCEPPAGKIPGAKLQLEVLELGRGVEDLEPTGFVFRKAASGATSKAKWRRKFTFGDGDDDLREGLYVFRLSLIGDDNTPLQSAQSEAFRVGQVPAPITTLSEVGSIFEAIATATALPGSREVPKLEALVAATEDRLLSGLSVRLEGLAGQHTIVVLQRLAEVEAELLEQPREIRGLSLDLAGTDTEFTWIPFDPDSNVPDEFLDAREALFGELTRLRPGVVVADDQPLRPKCELSYRCGRAAGATVMASRPSVP